MNTDYLLLENLTFETAQLHAAHMICGPVIGQLLQMLVKLIGAKNCLEIGTLTGYSALCIAGGLGVDGHLMTCEKSARHAQIAQKYFDQSPHGHKISLQVGEALATIQTLQVSFDFIFIDADKNNYPHYYEMLIPKLRPGGLMIVDNALMQEKPGVVRLNQMAKQDPQVEILLLAIRTGVLIIRKK